MTANNSTTDGLGFEEVNQPASSTENIIGISISGTDIYAEKTVNAESVYSTYVSGAGNAIYGQVMVAQNLYVDVAASGNAFHLNSEGALHSVGVGSKTSVYGASIQAGSSTLTAGSNLWKVFSTAFTSGTTSTPIVTVTNLTATDGIMVPAGSVNAGSFYTEGANASDEFSWIAVGL